MGRLRSILPADLETVYLKCLHKDTSRRFAGAGELADDLARFCSGEPIRARPVGPLDRGVKWAQRRRAAAALVLVVLLSLVGLLSFVAAFNGYQHHAVEHRTVELRLEQEARERERGRHESLLTKIQYVLDVRLAGVPSTPVRPWPA